MQALASSYRHSLWLLALVGMNCLLLVLTLFSVFSWMQSLGSIWIVIGLVFAQVYLLAFWAAFRGGSS